MLSSDVVIPINEHDEHDAKPTDSSLFAASPVLGENPQSAAVEVKNAVALHKAVIEKAKKLQEILKDCLPLWEKEYDQSKHFFKNLERTGRSPYHPSDLPERAEASVFENCVAIDIIKLKISTLDRIIQDQAIAKIEAELAVLSLTASKTSTTLQRLHDLVQATPQTRMLDGIEEKLFLLLISFFDSPRPPAVELAEAINFPRKYFKSSTFISLRKQIEPTWEPEPTPGKWF